MKLRLDLTEGELKLLKDMLYEETQVPQFDEAFRARKIHNKLEAAESSLNRGNSK